MKDTPLELNMLQQGPLAWLLRLGVFESFTLLVLLTLWGKHLWQADKCEYICSLPPTYFQTETLLLGIFSAYLCLSLAQGIGLCWADNGAKSRALWQRFFWLLLCSLIRGIPFLGLLLSLVALPAYRSVYLNSGLVLLSFRLLLEAYFIARKIRYSQLKTSMFRMLKWGLRRGPIISAIALAPFLVYVALPNFNNCHCRSPMESTINNMHTLQTILQIYAVDWGGVYPVSLLTLEQDASLPKKAYWEDRYNPCTGKKGREATMMAASDADLLKSVEKLGFRFDIKAGKSRCMVLYHRHSLTEYRIFGTDPNGQLLRDRASLLTLSNS